MWPYNFKSLRDSKRSIGAHDTNDRTGVRGHTNITFKCAFAKWNILNDEGARDWKILWLSQ